jgi:hypothetical protein
MVARKNFFIIYLLYIGFVSIAAAIFAFLFQKKFHIMDNNYNIIIENISFEFGSLIQNLFDNGNYFQIKENIKFYLIKFPAVPYLLLFIFKISLNYYFIVVFKNIIVLVYIFFFVIYY